MANVVELRNESDNREGGVRDADGKEASCYSVSGKTDNLVNTRNQFQ